MVCHEGLAQDSVKRGGGNEFVVGVMDVCVNEDGFSTKNEVEFLNFILFVFSTVS